MRRVKEAMASAFRILGEGQLSLQKFLLVTDQPVNVRDFRAMLEHLLSRTNSQTDLFVFSNLSMDTLDYTGPSVNEGSKGVWLGLGDPVRDLPREFHPPVSPPSDVRDVRVFCGGCLVVSGPTYAGDRDAAARLAAHPAFAGWPLVVLTDDAERATRSTMNFCGRPHEIRACGRHYASATVSCAPHRYRSGAHRRADEALVSEGTELPARSGGDRRTQMARVFSAP